MSTDPDAPRSSDPLREPPLQAGLPPDAWRLLTNFTRPSLIPQTFGVWPDDVASLKTLADIYAGKAQSVLGMFPFLDHGEGSRLEAVFQAHRERIYAPFADFLRATGIGEGRIWGAALPVLQALLLLGLRRVERDAGLWDQRSQRQRDGTLFAVMPDANVQFCRVSALPGRRGDRVCFPWGGPYNEYNKVQGLLESRYSGLVFASVGPDLEVVPDGHVIRKMEFAGLVRNSAGFWGSRYVLRLPILGMPEMKGHLPGLLLATQGICAQVAEVLPSITEVMRSGRYACLEGHGDYAEMAYAVLTGLLCDWAMDESLLRRPPSFEVTEEGAFVERSMAQKIRGEYPPLPGIAVLSDARPIWDWVTSKD